MFKFFLLVFFLFLPNKLYSEIKNEYHDNHYFYVGKMNSYNNEFTLYFKTRKKSILARGENSNYINDYPQDLYLYDKNLDKEYPLISYEWFPKSVKSISKNYNYPLFPEDFAYYLLNDNNTLILISAKKKYFENLKYDIKNKRLEIAKTSGRLNFIISSYAKNCGYKSLKDNYKCNIYKPLISKNLLN